MSAPVVSKVGAGGGGGGGDASESEQQVQTGHLEDVVAAVEALVTTLVARSAAPSASQPTIAIGGIVDAALASITAADADGEISLFRIDANGALWTMQAGALSSLVDTVGVGLRAGETAVPYKYLRVTTASTGVDFWSPGSGMKIGVKWLYVGWQGANACRITLWQGANADTTFTDGTDRVLFDKNLSADADGGILMVFPEALPWVTTTDDHELHLTTSADKIVSIIAGGYEFD